MIREHSQLSIYPPIFASPRKMHHQTAIKWELQIQRTIIFVSFSLLSFSSFSSFHSLRYFIFSFLTFLLEKREVNNRVGFFVISLFFISVLVTLFSQCIRASRIKKKNNFTGIAV